MRTAITAIGLLSLVFASAQDSPATRSRFEIGFLGSVDHCYRVLTTSEDQGYYDDLIELRDDFEIPRTSGSEGIEIAYTLRPSWTLESGIRYTFLGWGTKDLVATSFVTPEGNTGDPALPETGHFKYTFSYFGVPLMLRYQFGRHRIHFAPAFGLTLDAMHEATTTSYMEWADGHETRETRADSGTDYNSLSLSALADLGAIYRINDHFAVRLAPTGRYQLTELVDAPITAHLWSVGLLAGVRYHF